MPVSGVPQGAGPRGVWKVPAAVVAVLAVCAVLVFYGAGDGETASITGRETLTVGVPSDLPGLGQRKADGTYEGFDVDVATYIAGRLGIGEENLAFRSVSADAAATVLQSGTVDMVVAAYSITPDRAGRVTFGGPYYVAHQDILVREGDGSIKNVRDLRGRRLCQVGGSGS